MKKVVALILAVLFTFNPCIAKCVSLEVKEVLENHVLVDPNRDYDEVLRPYFVNARQCIEANWQDPKVGRTVKLYFTLYPDGSIDQIDAFEFPKDDLERIGILVAAKAIQDVDRQRYLPPLPAAQSRELYIVATFKSEKPHVPFDSARAKTILNGLLLASAGALAGFAIWALINNSGGNSGVANGYTNPDVDWVNGYRRNDGRYVAGYRRTSANGTTLDNFSTVGNRNPYTLKRGNKRP